MAPVSLPCVMGTACSFKTVGLEYEYTNEQLGMHMKFAHGGGSGPSHGERNKPEKFPHPSLEADSTSKAREDFEATWTQYKKKYNLSGEGLIRRVTCLLLNRSQDQTVQAHMWQAVRAK